MAVVVHAAAEFAGKYLSAAWSYEDPRTAHLPLVRSPVGMVSIISLYLLFVFSLWPRLMKHRKPLDLSRLVLVYNAVQVVCCAYMVVEGLRLGWGGRYSFLCEPLRYAMEPLDFERARLVYMYYLVKIVDMLDTVFMVLRKSFRQISFLHVYHHAGMVFVGWMGVKAVPEGHHTLLEIINAAVHCALYTYYFLVLYEPKFKVAWWKKYITMVQIMQFGINVVHETVPHLLGDCDLDKLLSAMIVVQNLFMFTLFSDFYIKSYNKKGRKPRDKES